MQVAPHLTGETGTYMYMSPEMVRHEMYDSRSDVYSWGVMLAETLQQKMPYDGVYLTPVQVGIRFASRAWHQAQDIWDALQKKGKKKGGEEAQRAANMAASWMSDQLSLERVLTCSCCNGMQAPPLVSIHGMPFE